MFRRKKKLLQAENEALKSELAEIRNERRLKLTDIEELSALLGTLRTIAGPVVNSDTAWRSTAVYACVRIIAGVIASLPLYTYRRKGPDDNELALDHLLFSVLHKQPNPIMSAFSFWEAGVAQVLLNGNLYALIGRNYGGDPLDLKLINPKRVATEEKNGRLIYTITLDDGYQAVYDQDDILHVPNIGWDGLKGMSTISAGMQAIGLSMAAEEHSARFFSNGAQPGGVLKYPKKLSPDQAEQLRDYWTRKHAGLENAHVPAILTEGGEFEQITINAEDAQLLESREFQVVDIARLFGVPPHLIGEVSKTSSWGTGIEQMSIGFVNFTLRPHLKRIEQEINRKLFRTNRFYSEFNVSGLLRGDVKARHESYRIARGSMQEPGYMTINEIRKLENLPPIAGGDEIIRPLGQEKDDQE